MRQVRAALLAVTSRVRAQLPHLSAHDAAVIDREIRSALEALGTTDPDEPTAPDAPCGPGRARARGR